MANLGRALSFVDRVSIYENSGYLYRHVAEIVDARVTGIFGDPPAAGPGTIYAPSV
jgi:hypothetical protein